jgi:hypothetical protein
MEFARCLIFLLFITFGRTEDEQIQVETKIVTTPSTGRLNLSGPTGGFPYGIPLNSYNCFPVWGFSNFNPFTGPDGVVTIFVSTCICSSSVRPNVIKSRKIRHTLF